MKIMILMLALAASPAVAQPSSLPRIHCNASGGVDVGVMLEMDTAVNTCVIREATRLESSGDDATSIGIAAYRFCNPEVGMLYGEHYYCHDPLSIEAQRQSALIAEALGTLTVVEIRAARHRAANAPR